MNAMPPEINQSKLESLRQANPACVILDVRTVEEFRFLGHIPEARLLPLHELPARVDSLDKNVLTVVVCQHGVRSAQAAAFLIQHGFSDVFSLADGMAEWTGATEH
jgi:sulfur dioxygenase